MSSIYENLYILGDGWAKQGVEEKGCECVCVNICVWIRHFPRGGGMLILSVKLMKDVTASGLFIDLKLVCATQIEYQVEFTFFFQNNSDKGK